MAKTAHIQREAGNAPANWRDSPQNARVYAEVTRILAEMAEAQAYGEITLNLKIQDGTFEGPITVTRTEKRRVIR